jgi:hypothetical protein
MTLIDQTRRDAEIAALAGQHERLCAMVFAYKLYDRLRRNAVGLKSERLRRDADSALAYFDHCYARFWAESKAGFDPDQPRMPAGNPDGGQWASGGGFEGRLGQSLATAADQAPRSDLRQLQEIASDPAIRPRIDEAWKASNPEGTSLREHGFWISRNEATGELLTRPFANPGSNRSIVPGPAPHDAIAFFHTHPLKPEFGGRPGPSVGDMRFAADIGLPGLLQSHRGMYYFGPSLRERTPRRPPGAPS